MYELDVHRILCLDEFLQRVGCGCKRRLLFLLSGVSVWGVMLGDPEQRWDVGSVVHLGGKTREGPVVKSLCISLIRTCRASADRQSLANPCHPALWLDPEGLSFKTESCCLLFVCRAHVCSDASVVSTLCDPMDHSLPGSSICGILQARTLEWVAMPSSRGSSWPRDWTQVSYASSRGRRVLYH